MAMQATTQKWKIFSLDVWAGEHGNWDINNWFNVGTIDIPSDAGDTQLLQILKEEGFITRTDIAEIQNWGWDDCIMIVDTTNDDYPVYQLDLIQE